MNSIIEKKCKVVMLPTNEKAIKGDILMSSEMLYDKDIYPLSFITNPYWEWNKGKQHLYIISDDEIKDGDWVYENNLNQKTKIYQIEKRDGQLMFFRFENVPIWLNKNVHNCKKIIATTNTSLNLPQPSPQFITKFIESYNKGNVISDVLVEYNCGDSQCSLFGCKNHVGCKHENIQIPKVNLKNNTITIKRLKENWNREELPEKIIELCKKFQRIKNYNALDFDTNQTEFKQWISNNL